MSAIEKTSDAFWMPFTSNRTFKQNPRLVQRAEGMYYYKPDGSQVLDMVAGLWCCNRPPGGRGAGHIWYDFLWDVIPHRDRFNRRWDDKWFPKMGP